MEEQRETEVKQEVGSSIAELVLLLKSVQNDVPSEKLNKISIKDAFGRRIYF